MRRRAMRSLLVLSLVVAATAAMPLTAHGQTPAVNRIVVYATFGNSAPGPDASLVVHVSCANEGGQAVVDVFDETATMSAPWAPTSFDIPVLDDGGSNTFVGCTISGQWVNVTGYPEITCGVADPGTPPPDPSPPSGCGALSRNTYTDAFFAETVSGAVYNVNFIMLLADQLAPVPTPAPEIVSAPIFTG
jgi:hypothetical protein